MTTKSVCCRGCRGLEGDPRIEREKLVWVCRRCGDRTEIVCAQCKTRFSSPGRQGARFTAWCSPCGASVKLDAMGTEQRREVLPIPKKVEPEPEPPEVDEAIDESDDLGDTEGANPDAIVVSVEPVDVGDYRAPGRVVNLVCPPRQIARWDSVPSWLSRLGEATASLSMLWCCSFFVFAMLAGLGPRFFVTETTAVGMALSGAALIVVWLLIGILTFAFGDPSTPATRLRAGPDGLEMHAEGHESWRADAQRVQRVFTVAVTSIDEKVRVRVRVQLDDGTEKELLAGLSKEEAREVVAQVDRALPGRQADL